MSFVLFFENYLKIDPCLLLWRWVRCKCKSCIYMPPLSWHYALHCTVSCDTKESNKQSGGCAICCRFTWMDFWNNPEISFIFCLFMERYKQHSQVPQPLPCHCIRNVWILLKTWKIDFIAFFNACVFIQE